MMVGMENAVDCKGEGLMKKLIAAILLVLSFAQLAQGAAAGTGTQQFCPISPTRTYLDIAAHPETGELEAYLYTIDVGARAPVGGGLLYRVETKGSGGTSSTDTCYMATGANGKAAFEYDPAFPGCINSWFVYCPNGATALSGGEDGKIVRQMCLNGTGTEQARIDGNLIIPCGATGTPVDNRNHILSHNEFAFCNYSPTGFEQLCWPLLLILGLLLSASFAVGKNPFAVFDLSSPRMGRGRQYTMRSQQKSFDYMSYAMGSHQAFETAGKVRDAMREKEVGYVKDGSGKFVKNSETGKWEKDGTGRYIREEKLKHGEASRWGEYAPLSLIGKGVNEVVGKPISSLLRRDAGDLNRLRKEQQEKESKKKIADEDAQKNRGGEFAAKLGVNLSALKNEKDMMLGSRDEGKNRKVQKKGKQRMQLQSTAQNIQYMAGDIYRGLESIFGVSKKGIYLQPMSKEGQEQANYYGSLGFGGTMGAIWERVKANFTVSNMIIAGFQSGVGKKYGIATQLQLAYYVVRPDMLPIGLSVLSESLSAIKASAESRIQIQKLLDQLSTGIGSLEGYEGRKGSDGSLVFAAKDGTYIVVDPNTMEFAMYRLDQGVTGKGAGWQVMNNASGQWEALEDLSRLNGLVGAGGKVEISAMALEKLMKDGSKAVYIQLDLQNGKADLLKTKAQYVDLLERKAEHEETLAKFQESVVMSGWMPTSAWDRENWRNGIAVARGLDGILEKDLSAEGTEKLDKADRELKRAMVDFCKENELDKLAGYIGDISTKEGIAKAIGILLDRAGDKEYAKIKNDATAIDAYIAKLIKNGEIGEKLSEAGDLYELGKKSAEYSQNLALSNAMQMQSEARRKLIEATEKGNQEAIASASLELQTAKDFVNATYSEKLYTSAEGKVGEIIEDYRELGKKERAEYQDGIREEAKKLTGSDDIDAWIGNTLEKLRKGELAQDDLEQYANAIELKMKLDICRSIDENKKDADISAALYGNSLHNASDFFEARATLAHLPVSTEIWGAINQMDPTNESFERKLEKIASMTYDTNGLKDWYGSSRKYTETIGRFEELQHTLQENALRENPDPVLEMLWEKHLEGIRDAENGQVTPGEKNKAGIRGMEEAIAIFGKELEDYQSKDKSSPETYNSYYKAALDAEIMRLEDGIKNAGYDREWMARANSMLSELVKSKEYFEQESAKWNSDENLVIRKHLAGTGGDPLSLAKQTNNSLYYASEKFKEQQMYENRDALRAPHYLTDVDELKEGIQSGAMRDESVKQALQQLKDKEWIEALKRSREDMQHAIAEHQQGEGERPVDKSTTPYKKYSRPEK